MIKSLSFKWYSWVYLYSVWFCVYFDWFLPSYFKVQLVSLSLSFYTFDDDTWKCSIFGWYDLYIIKRCYMPPCSSSQNIVVNLTITKIQARVLIFFRKPFYWCWGLFLAVWCLEIEDLVQLAAFSQASTFAISHHIMAAAVQPQCSPSPRAPATKTSNNYPFRGDVCNEQEEISLGDLDGGSGWEWEVFDVYRTLLNQRDPHCLHFSS
jgi:hypothetical protein